MSVIAKRGGVLRMFSSAVFSQAVLSASSLLVGLLLIRLSTDQQYGAYVLVWNALLLLSSLQNSFLGPAMMVRLPQLAREGQGELLGGLYREQSRVVWPLLMVGLVIVLALHFTGVLDGHDALLGAAAAIAAALALRREFFRISQLAHQRASSVFRGDLLYAVMLVIGVAIATQFPLPAPVAVLALGVAALFAGSLMSRDLRHHEAWDEKGLPGILRQIAPMGLWATAGAAIHWTFSQGYTYLVAGMLDVTAVAAIAAIRMLLTPINLISSGISSLMLSMTSRWLQQHSVSTVLRRQLLFAGGLAFGSLIYCALVWLLRDWLSATVLKKQFAHRDTLLLLWSAIFLVMIFRDQLVSLLVAREQLRRLAALTLFSAVSSLATCWWGMRHFGTPGALMGVLTGEVVNVTGLLVLSLREARRERDDQGAASTVVADPAQ